MVRGVNVRIPQVINPEEALRCYYLFTEIGNKEIRAMFGNLGSPRISKMKKLVREVMSEEGVLVYDATAVNTEIAFHVWGINVKKLEKYLRRTENG